MRVPAVDQREKYVEYTEHCLKLAKQATDLEARAILREMAAEWLKLAETAKAHKR
jgi:hypothetical protein